MPKKSDAGAASHHPYGGTRRAAIGYFIQLCFVVQDLDLAMARYSELFGAGPWFVSDGPAVHDDPTTYRGVPAPLRSRIALGYAGDMMFELVSPKPGSRSIFTEWADARGYDSLHHYGFGTDDYDATIASLEAAGTELLMTSATARGTRVVIVEEASDMGALKEYIELLPATVAFYAFMKAASARWDGKALVYADAIPSFS